MVGAKRNQEPGLGHMGKLTAHKDINKSVSQKSVISTISGSGQESKNPKPRNV